MTFSLRLKLQPILVTFYLLTFGLSAFGQDSCIVHFVTNKLKNEERYLISMNDQEIGKLSKGQSLDYILYEGGRLTVHVTDHSTGRIFTRTTDVQTGKDYYFLIGATMSEYFTFIDSNLGERLKLRSNLQMLGREDKSNPIITEKKYRGPKEKCSITFISCSLPKNTPIDIIVNGRKICSIMSGQNIVYKMYSVGEIKVGTSASAPERSITTLPDQNYYYVVGCRPAYYGFQFVPPERGRSLATKNQLNLVEREKPENPIVKKEGFEGPGEATCILLNKEGYLLTNYHVIKGANKINITGVNEDYVTKFAANLVAVDRELDFALLKLKTSALRFDSIPYSFASTSAPQGSDVFVLGYPMTNRMGVEIKVTDGIISSKTGYKNTMSEYQFSAPVQAGNSGGPMFNHQGQIEGIVNAKLFLIAENVSYAIKSQYARAFISMCGLSLPKGIPSAFENKTLAEKIKLLKNFIFVVEVE